MLMGEPPRLPGWVALVAVAAAAAAPATPEETLGARAARFVASLAAADRAALDERIARKRSLAAVPGLLPALPDHFVATDGRRLEDAAPPCGAWEHCPYDGYYMPLRTRVVADGSSVFVEYATYFCYNGYLSWCSQWYGGRRDDAGRFETCSDASDTFSGSSTWTVLLRDVEVAATYVDANGATSYALRVREAEHGFVERGDDRFVDGKYMLWRGLELDTWYGMDDVRAKAAEGDTEWNSAFGYIENMNALEFDDWAAAYDDEDGDEGEDRRLEDADLTYALVGDRVTWYEAAAVCDKAGGRLAGVDGDDAVGAVEAFLEGALGSWRRRLDEDCESTAWYCEDGWVHIAYDCAGDGCEDCGGAARAMDVDEVAWIVDEDCGGDVRLWCDDDVLWYEDCWSGDSAALGNPFCGGCDGGDDDDDEWDDDDGDIWGAWVGFRQGESGGLVDVAGDAIGDDVWEADDDWTAGECGLWDRDGYFEVEPCEYGLAAVCEFDDDVFSYSYAWIEGVDVTTDEACAYSPSCTCACETCADFLEGRCGTECAVDEAEQVYVYCQCADHDHCTAENWRKFLPADPSYGSRVLALALAWLAARGLGAPPAAAADDCALDRWTYGDATETTGAWADLVGVAGAGGCYEAGAAWSAVAVAAGDAAATTTRAAPLCAGSYVGDTFRPASGCYFAVVERPAVVDCLEGTWFLVNGGSNALTFFKWLADQVSPDLVSMGDTFESEVIDVVFGADGDVEYVFKGSLCSFGPVNCNYGGSLSPDAWDSRHRTSVAAALAAPAYVAGGTRITLVVAQFYDQTSMALEGVAGATAWAGANFVFYTQCMIWYPCHQQGWCYAPRLGSSYLEIRDAFARDVDAVLAVAEPVCARANAHCFFAPAAYNTRASGGGLPEILKPKVDATAWAHLCAHLIDWTGLVTDWIPEEIVDGHTTPFPHITAYNMIWNTVCGDLPAAGCPEYLVADKLCFDATNGETGDWVMASEVDYCTYARVDAVPVSVKLQAPATVAGAAGLADCLCALGLGETGGASGSSSAKELCKQKNRLFCGGAGDGWALAGVGFGVAAAARGVLRGEEEAAAPARGDEGRQGLGGARYVASVHIVLGHLFAKGAVDDVYLYGWGYTWVPFFFMLSGYVLAHSRLASRDPSKVERPTTYLAKRLATVYPAYAVGLFLALGVRVARGVALPETKWMLYQAFLLQAFDPRATEQVFQFHSGQDKGDSTFHCWFLSCLVPYWLLFGPVYAKVRNASLEACFAALVVLSLIPWLLVLVPELADEDNEWYRRHAVGDTSSATDLWVVFLKFHPLCYFHVFLYGVVLARLRANLKAGADGPLARFLGAVARGSATAGFGGLLLVFLARDLRPAAHKLSCRLPLQAMILVGLSPIDAGRAADPVAAAFAKLPAFFGDISYPQRPPVASPAGPPSTSTSSPSSSTSRAARRCWPTASSSPPRRSGAASRRRAARRCFGRALAVAAGSRRRGLRRRRREIVVVVRGRRGNGTNATVWLAAEALDVRLNWTSSTRGALINPSLLLVNGDIVRAARAHALRSERGEGAYRVPGESFVRIVVEETASWSSDIVLAAEPYGGNLSAPFDEWRLWDLDGDLATGTPASLSRPSLLSHLGDGAAWGALCEPVAAFYEANNTVVRKVVGGPEDPKLVALPGGGAWGLAFNSYPPKHLAGNCDGKARAVSQMDGAYDAAYEFAGAPPFGITRVSRPIELQGGGAAFPSSLLYAQGKVVLAYGVDDASSRALVMSAAYLEEPFVQDDAWCNATAR
ncbi:hypothetical protein JL720_12913 [Aureococcus anophagefferens]|nr:hypothetical protein JL720_12913 [Aureococcus anophagefferens]